MHISKQIFKKQQHLFVFTLTEAQTANISNFILTETEIKFNSNQIKKLEDFEYLGAWIRDSQTDLNTHKAQTWLSYNEMNQIWIDLKLLSFYSSLLSLCSSQWRSNSLFNNNDQQDNLFNQYAVMRNFLLISTYLLQL